MNDRTETTVCRTWHYRSVDRETGQPLSGWIDSSAILGETISNLDTTLSYNFALMRDGDVIEEGAIMTQEERAECERLTGEMDVEIAAELDRTGTPTRFK